MTALRWLIGLASAAALVLFLLIMIVGQGLSDAYRSGSGGEAIMRTFLTFAVPLMLVGMLVTAFAPHSRVLMHCVAACVVAAAAGCTSLLSSHPGEGLLYMGFLGLWLLYYFLAVWMRH